MRRQRFPLWMMILLNRRLSDYKRVLRNALSKGYRIGGILDFWRSKKNAPWIVLRHDVDMKCTATDRMLDAEREIGVSSSWYFRWETADKETIRRTVEGGGEVALHYETLATLCIERGIHSKDQITEDLLIEAREALRGEIEEFRRRFDVPCLTIAAHGHEVNQKVGMANNEIIDPDFFDQAEIEIESYDPRLLEKTDCYISDYNITVNYGWRYKTSLEDAIRDGRRKVYFLSHPGWWFWTPRERVRLFMKYLKAGVREKDIEFPWHQHDSSPET